jgi:hypothetical protein
VTVNQRRSNNQTIPVQAKNFCENEYQNHRHKYFGFSDVGSDALQTTFNQITEKPFVETHRIPNDANGISRCHSSSATRKPCAQMDEARIEGITL